MLDYNGEDKGMGIRIGASLAAIAMGLGLSQVVYVFSAGLYTRGIARLVLASLPATLGVFAASVAGMLFFVFFYGAASKLTDAKARANVALAAAFLMFAQTLSAGWELIERSKSTRRYAADTLIESANTTSQCVIVEHKAKLPQTAPATPSGSINWMSVHFCHDDVFHVEHISR